MDIYADDTNLSLSSNWKTLPLLNQSLSQDLSEVDRWARENKIYMNMQKSKASVGNEEAPTKAHGPRHRKTGSKNG